MPSATLRPAVAPVHQLFRAALAAIAAFVGLLALTLDPASASQRVALVIGNSAYKTTTELKNPRNDAEAMAAALSSLGFRVLKGIDADQYNMRLLVRSFSQEVETAELALFYYAGHGMQVNGKNYLIPTDAKLEQEADLDFEAVELSFILRQMERSNRTNIVLLDACRNNPLTAKLASTLGQRSIFVGRGLARVESGLGTYIGYATRPDTIALDSVGEDHSPFTAALLKYLKVPGLDVEVMMRRVRDDVRRATDGKQVPYSDSVLIGDKVVLNLSEPASEAQAPAASPQVAPTPSLTVPEPKLRASDKDLELAYWGAVEDSDNPEFIRAYLEAFPNGTFAPLARVMLEELEAREKAGEEKGPPAGEPQAALPPKAPQDAQEPAEPARAPAAQQPQEPASEAAPTPRRKPRVVNVTPRPEPEEAEQEPAPKKAAPLAAKPIKKKPPVAVPAPAKRVIEKPAKRKQQIQTLREKKPQVREKAASTEGKQCGFCFTCQTSDCPKRWACGAKYLERKADGLCNFAR